MANEDRRRTELQDQRSEFAEFPPHLIEQFKRMVLMLPETPHDGGASLVESILNAVDVKATNKLWESRDPEHLVGKSLIVEEASYSMSDYQGGLGVFLVVKAVIEETGEEITFPTGSISVVAQIVKAYAGDELPLRCKIVLSDRPTRSGYMPQHLVVADEQPTR